MEKEKPFKIAKAILESNKTVVLTGAGISTESGIPDFRSPGGIWSKFDPSVMTSYMLSSNPVYFYRKALAMLGFFNEIKNVRPNRAHYILAEMENDRLISCIITQNIDGLHIKAGSRRVYEVHGNLREGYCMSCDSKVSLNLLIDKVKRNNIPPLCDNCGGVLRPAVILFGDELPECFVEAAEEVRSCSLLLVIGSSLDAYLVWNEKAGIALEAIYNEIEKSS